MESGAKRFAFPFFYASVLGTFLKSKTYGRTGQEKEEK